MLTRRLSKILREMLKMSENKELAEVDSGSYSITFEPLFWEKIWKVEQNLSAELMKIDFKMDKNIDVIYNPLDYAAELHQSYMRKFLLKAPEVLFLGMNPGLMGMCQTAVIIFSINIITYPIPVFILRFPLDMFHQ